MMMLMGRLEALMMAATVRSRSVMIPSVKIKRTK
jgi:hypothetical protein